MTMTCPICGASLADAARAIGGDPYDVLIAHLGLHTGEEIRGLIAAARTLAERTRGTWSVSDAGLDRARLAVESRLAQLHLVAVETEFAELARMREGGSG